MVCACLYAGPGPTRWWAAITVTEVLAFLDMTNGAPAREDGVGATITPIGRRVGSSGAWWRTGAASQTRVFREWGFF